MAIHIYTCKFCNNNFTPSSKYQKYCTKKCLNNDPNSKIREFGKTLVQENIIKFEAQQKKCLECQTLILYKYRMNKFCSKKCGAIFSHRVLYPTAPRKIKVKVRYYKPYTKLYGLYNCHHCHNNFWRIFDGQKCCSKSCVDSIRSQNKCRKTQISYFSKFDHKIIYLQSIWEVKIAELLDSLNIIWNRPSTRIKWFDTTLQKPRTYLPDFYLSNFNLYIDVKNPFKIEQDKDKLSQLALLIPLYVGTLTETINYIKQLTS